MGRFPADLVFRWPGFFTSLSTGSLLYFIFTFSVLFLVLANGPSTGLVSVSNLSSREWEERLAVGFELSFGDLCSSD